MELRDTPKRRKESGAFGEITVKWVDVFRFIPYNEIGTITSVIGRYRRARKPLWIS
jgi:hypothetical protein